MKRIPWAYIVKFSDAIDQLDRDAKVRLRAFLKQVDLSDPERAREHIAEIVERVVGATDAVASSMAAGFYDGIREYQTGEKLGALADSGRKPESTKNATYGITSRLVKADEPDISLVEGLLVQRIGYEVKRSVGRTMYRNGQRDPNKPKFARIPVGGDSCEFCRMLASRGFAYNSELTAGKFDPDHYHDGCRCEVVCSWEKDPRIAGLSEEEYNDRAYGEHRDAYKSWASKDHSQHQANQAAKRKNRYTEDGRLKAGYSGQRIDKQAAYTEADRKKVAARAAAQRGNTQRGVKRVISVPNEEDIVIGRSVGAAAFRDPVRLPDGTITKLSGGTKITGIKTIAGEGADRDIDTVDTLVAKHGGKKNQWRKRRGNGYVDDMGMSRPCELHWYEEKTVGRVEMKVKRFYY